MLKYAKAEKERDEVVALIQDSVPLTDEYLATMQRRIDATKGKNFKLTPITPAGW